MKPGLLFGVALVFMFVRNVDADIIVNVAETNDGHVRFDYTGTLDLAGLPASPFFAAFELHQLHPAQGGFQNQFGGITMRSLGAAPFSSNAALWLDNSIATPPASLFSGDSFAFGRDYLAVEQDGLDGDSWSGTGSMQFNNTTFEDLGIDLSQDRVWTLDNIAANTITVTEATSAVPEPTSFVLMCLGASVFWLLRRGLTWQSR